MHVVVTDLHDRWPPRQIAVSGEVTIGRDPVCAVVIEDPQLGPIQTRISIAAMSMTIENVGPSARTRVNGESIGKRGRVLMDRAAVIEIGDYILRFSVVASRRVRPATTLAPDAGGVEHTFLDALRARPGDLDTRLVYADWLEQQDRLPMAAVVRYAAGALPLDPETREVARWMDPAWRATVWCGPIEHCAADPERPRPPCPRRWEHLPSGAEPNRRPCTSCSHDVELVDNLAAIDDRASGSDAPFVVCPSLDRARVVAEIEVRRRRSRLATLTG